MEVPNRTARLSARCRPRERQLIERAAERRGVRLAELIRDATIAEARRALTAEDSELKAQRARDDDR